MSFGIPLQKSYIDVIIDDPLLKNKQFGEKIKQLCLQVCKADYTKDRFVHKAFNDIFEPISK